MRGYNVLLVTIDTLRADRVGAYGSAAALTPAIDRLAAQGLRFESVRAHAPLTLPSHASLLTGRIPPRHGVRDNGTYRLDPSHALPAAIAASLTARERSAAPGGMSFWTDAAILGGAGIPSVLFGPGGAGLHSAVEYVHVDDVYVCRDVLVEVARRITGSL